MEAPPINALAVMRLATCAHGAGVGEAFARRAYHLAVGDALFWGDDRLEDAAAALS